MDRATRFIANRKQDKIRVVKDQPSIQSMREGEEVLFFGRDGVLSRYRKERGQLWRSDMTKGEGNKVGGTLKTSRLEYSSSFVDYRAFSHNFTADVDASKIYLPWFNDTELGTFRTGQGFLAPFKMTCHKLIVKPPDLDDNADDIVFAIEKKNDGDDTTDALCNYTYSTSFVDHTAITVNQSDWSATPTVDVGDVVALAITASDAGIVTSSKAFWVTSIWKTIVTI